MEGARAQGMMWRRSACRSPWDGRAEAVARRPEFFSELRARRQPGRAAKLPAVKIPVIEDDAKTADALLSVSLNGGALFEVEGGIISAAGATRVWTKAGSVTLLTNFSCVKKRR
jgi:hypothetical protein